ncbi:hypothetical protein RQP46_002192 [Phenoliferia psychrophenolica]
MDLEVPTAPITSLLSLPNELLIRIGRGVAPEGGRKVGALRLACRRLERAVSHIAWASIYVEAEPSLHNPLIAALLWDLNGRAARVTSVRWDLPQPDLECVDVHTAVLSKLRSLKRLHILGLGEDGPYPREALPQAVRNALGAFPHLKDGLILERIGQDGMSTGSMSKWLPGNIEAVSLIDCEMSHMFFTEYAGTTAIPSSLKSPVRRLVLDGCPPTDSSQGAIAFIGVALTSATSLFDADSPTTGAGEAYMLEGLSHAPITNLSLPVNDFFSISPTLGAVVMQNVTILTLETDPVAPFVAKPDLYTPATHTTLIIFLSTSFPNLTALNLTGWFDATGIQGPATATPRTLSIQFSLVGGLLSALRWTNVVEIRLKSSNGHADGDSECCFTRADKDAPEWNARLALYI